MKLLKPELSSIELHAVIAELQPLVNSKIDQIYQSEKNEFFFQLHTPRAGKSILRVVSGKLLYLTQHKPSMTEPFTFCMQLRKHLTNIEITEIKQCDAQRIARFTLKRSDIAYFLFIELFSKGNIVLCDEKNSIIAILEPQSWESRELRSGEKYLLPPLETNIFTITKKQLEAVIKKSEKDKLVTLLATELGMGGAYAEELCARSAIDKNRNPKELEKKEKDALGEALKTFLKELETPKGLIVEKMVIIPIKLTGTKDHEECPTFNEALDKFLSTSKADRERAKKEQQYQSRAAELQRILTQQEQTLKGLDKAIEEETEKGNVVYQHYTEIKKFLDTVQKAREEGGWDKVNSFMKTIKKVKKIDLKEKKIVLEWDR